MALHLPGAVWCVDYDEAARVKGIEAARRYEMMSPGWRGALTSGVFSG